MSKPKPVRKREGKELRRARNIAKKWMRQPTTAQEYRAIGQFVATEVAAKRYEAACALILAHTLRK